MRLIFRLGSSQRTFFCANVYFCAPHGKCQTFRVRAPLAMILGALERGNAQLSPGSKIFENDFLKMILQHEPCRNRSRKFLTRYCRLLESSIGNPMQTGIWGSSISKMLPICIAFPIQNPRSVLRNFSNNICTFHAVKSSSENRFPKFWILVKAEHSLFPTHLKSLPTAL